MAKPRISSSSTKTEQVNTVYLQLLLDAVLNALNEKSDRLYEPYILASDKFQDAISHARQKLNIHGIRNIEEALIPEWSVQHLSKKSSVSDDEKYKYLKQFYETVDTAVTEAGLPVSWQFYIASYIVNGTPPSSVAYTSERYMEVKSINEDSLTLEIKKGVRHEEFINSWLAIVEHLGKGRRKNKATKEQTRLRDLQMYGKRRQGYTNRQLANEYFENDAAYSVDAVKKALKRQKKLFDEGIDLAK